MPISGARPIAPSSEEIARACRTRFGIANLLHELVYQALPEPWDHEMPKAMYGSYWHALLEAIGEIRDELGRLEYSHRNQLPQEYLQDEALVAVARDLEFQAGRYTGGSAPLDVLLAAAARAREASQALKRFRPEPVERDGQLPLMILIGDSQGVRLVRSATWQPYLEYKARVMEEVIEMTSFDVLRAQYENARRALARKAVQDKLSLEHHPVQVEIVVRQGLRP
jgi:hypothetical protein